MSEGYIIGGGGATGATLTVTGVAGDTVTITKDSKTYTRTFNSDGVAVFKGLATGTWTVTMTNGTQTASMTVVVTADYETSISYFTATINVTYPAGSTCTATDGTTTLTAPDTSGAWTCVVPNAGTWTVTATNGDKTKSQSVSITTKGQTASVGLVYQFIIYDNGSEKVALTFQRAGDIGGTTNAGKKSTYVLFDNRSSNYGTSNDHHTANTIKTTTAVSLDGYSKLCCYYTNNGGFRMRVGIKAGAIPNITWTSDGSTYDSASLSTAATGPIELDISNVSGSRYIGVTGAIQNAGGVLEAYVRKIWLE